MESVNEWKRIEEHSRSESPIRGVHITVLLHDVGLEGSIPGMDLLDVNGASSPEYCVKREWESSLKRVREKFIWGFPGIPS